MAGLSAPYLTDRCTPAVGQTDAANSTLSSISMVPAGVPYPECFYPRWVSNVVERVKNGARYVFWEFD